MSLGDHLEKLKNLVAVAKYGSFNRAATKVGLSQPSLSTSIRILERDINQSLLTRTGRGVIPTDAGRRLIELSNRISVLTADAERDLKVQSRTVRSQIRVGTHESISIYFFPDFIRYLNSAHPNIGISLKTGRSKPTLDWLKEGEIDVSVCVEPHVDKKVDSQTLYIDQFNFYALPSVTDPKSLPLILVADALEMTGRVLKAHLSPKLYAGHKRTLECENHETVKALVEEGLGIGILPDCVARRSLKSHQLAPVSGYPKNFASHTIGVAVLPHRKNDPDIQIFCEELIRFSQRWIG